MQLFRYYIERVANAEMIIDTRNKRCYLKSLRKIERYEEILIHYGEDYFTQLSSQTTSQTDCVLTASQTTLNSVNSLSLSDSTYTEN